MDSESIENDEFVENFVYTNGYSVFLFNQNVLPSFIAGYSSTIFLFYATIVYVCASSFRSAMVPLSYEIFITDAPFTQDILMICTCIFIYRVQ